MRACASCRAATPLCPLMYKALLPAPYAGFDTAARRTISSGAAPLGRRQNDPRPPHMLRRLLRSVLPRPSPRGSRAAVDGMWGAKPSLLGDHLDPAPMFPSFIRSSTLQSCSPALDGVLNAMHLRLPTPSGARALRPAAGGSLRARPRDAAWR
jgi:hypothetical protein